MSGSKKRPRCSGLLYYLNYYLGNKKMRNLVLKKIPFRKKLVLARALFSLRLGERPATLPVYYQMEPTTRCNLKCPHCTRFFISLELGDMSMDLFRGMIDDNPSLVYLLLQGQGEPMLHKDIYDMITYARSRGIVVVLCTNGTLLTDQNIDRLIQCDLNNIAISVDGVGADLERLRPPTNFARLKKNLESLREKKRHTDLILSFWVTIQKDNVESFLDVVDFASEMEVDQMNFQHMNQTLDEALKNRCVLADGMTLEELNERIRDKCSSVGIHCNVPATTVNTVRRKCMWPWFGAYIDFRGNMMPCCAVFDVQNAMGNLGEQSVKKIWHDAGYRNLRKALTSPHVPAFCRGCNNL